MGMQWLTPMWYYKLVEKLVNLPKQMLQLQDPSGIQKESQQNNQIIA